MRWIKEVFLNFKRSGFMSLISIGTIVITITMLGGYYLMREALDHFMDRLSNKVEVVVFLRDDTEKAAIDGLIADAKALTEVAEASYVSKGDAYQEFAKDREMKAVLDSYGGNPLPDSLILKLNSHSRQAISAVTAFFNARPEVEEIQYGGEDIENLLNIVSLVKLIAGIAGIIFTVASLLVVSNIIKLTIYARRQDIYVFRMVGATETYIRMPFIVEGLIHGFIGGIGGWAVLYSVINVLVIEIRKETGVDLSFFHLLRPEFLFYKMLAACAAAGSMLGFLGSLLSQGRSFK